MLSVKDFYNKYHKSFDRTRYSVWRAVRDFIEVIPPGSTVFEAGCGNGKNLEYMNEKDLITIGVDFSDKLVDICKEMLYLCVVCQKYLQNLLNVSVFLHL